MRRMTDDHGNVDRDTWTALETFMQDFSEENYQTWLEVTANINDAEKAMRAYTDATKAAVSETKELSYIDIVSGVQKLSDGLDKLDEIYADVFDGNSFDYSSILNNEDFTTIFGKYTDEYNKFIQTITNSPSNIKACQSAFNDLATAYISESGAISDVTEETKTATIAMLEQMGIANANEVITRKLAVQKELLSYQTDSLKDATYDEIYALFEESNAGSVAQSYYENYISSEMDLLSKQLDTTAMKGSERMEEMTEKERKDAKTATAKEQE